MTAAKKKLPADNATAEGTSAEGQQATAGEAKKAGAAGAAGATKEAQLTKAQIQARTTTFLFKDYSRGAYCLTHKLRAHI